MIYLGNAKTGDSESRDKIASKLLDIITSSPIKNREQSLQTKYKLFGFCLMFEGSKRIIRKECFFQCGFEFLQDILFWRDTDLVNVRYINLSLTIGRSQTFGFHVRIFVVLIRHWRPQSNECQWLNPTVFHEKRWEEDKFRNRNISWFGDKYWKQMLSDYWNQRVWWELKEMSKHLDYISFNK